MPTAKLKKRLMKFKGALNQGYSFALLRYTPLNTQWLSQEIQKLNIDRLHVGCGDILLPGWLNIGFERRQEYGRIKSVNGKLFLNYNLLAKWPFEENSIQYIAGSHFIEHLDLNEGIRFAKESYRVLKKGGIFRLSCPDLEIYARNYVANNSDFFNHKLIREWCVFKNAVTPGEIFIAKAYDSGQSHRWFYDFSSLRHVLEVAGFKEVRKTTRLTGKTPGLPEIEPEKRELETLYIEAEKG